jgi:uncharacterized membrane protein YGL010W
MARKRTLQSYFKEYAQYHRTSGNEFCHFVGIPLILVTLLGLLGRIALGPIDLGIVLLVGSVVWYLTLDWKLGAPFAFVAAGSYFLGRAIEVPWLWGLFVLGWIFQGIGHYVYEKRSPAFLKNVEHLLIGPLWVFARILNVT